MKRTFALFCALVLGAAAGQAAVHQLTWDGVYFTPQNVTIQLGDSVRWRNLSAMQPFHVVSDGGFYAFDSGVVWAPGEYVFDFVADPPTVPYFQNYQETYVGWESGWIQIQGSPTPAPTATPNLIPATSPGGAGVLLAALGLLLARRRRGA